METPVTTVTVHNSDGDSCLEDKLQKIKTDHMFIKDWIRNESQRVYLKVLAASDSQKHFQLQK